MRTSSPRDCAPSNMDPRWPSWDERLRYSTRQVAADVGVSRSVDEYTDRVTFYTSLGGGARTCGPTSSSTTI